MTKIGVPELGKRAEEIVENVKRTREAVDIEESGVIVAHVIPAAVPRTDQVDEAEIAKFWSDLKDLSSEINQAWPADVSAEDAINDVRREL